MSAKADVGQAAREVDRSDLLHGAVRFGFVCHGLVYLVLAWLGLQLAFGERDGEVDEHGALHQLSEQPFGEAVLLAVVAGMALLVLWRLVELVVEHRDEETWDRWRHRLIAAGTGLMYAVIGVSALAIVLGEGSNPRHREKSWTAAVFGWPAMAWRGLTGRHAKHLDAEGRSGESGRLYRVLGTVGYLAKGAAVGIVGAFVVWAALSHDASKSGGIDEALSRLLHQPAGPWLLGAVALGLGCFGLFELARARHLSRRPGK